MHAPKVIQKVVFPSEPFIPCTPSFRAVVQTRWHRHLSTMNRGLVAISISFLWEILVAIMAFERFLRCCYPKRHVKINKLKSVSSISPCILTWLWGFDNVNRRLCELRRGE